MSKVDETRRAFEAAVHDADSLDLDIIEAASAHTLAVLEEYEDRDYCSGPIKAEALDGVRCVHYAEGRHPRYQGKPLRECRLALIEQLEALVGPREENEREEIALREHLSMRKRMVSQWIKIPPPEHEHIQLQSEPDD